MSSATPAIISLFFLALVVTIPVSADEHVISMLNDGREGSMVFEPAYLKVQPGDQVTFKATDPMHNTVSHFVPDGAQTWEGEMSQDMSLVLEKEGVYIYKCFPHGAMGMVGVIQVGKAVNRDAAIKSATALSQKMIINKNRLAQYLGQIH